MKVKFEKEYLAVMYQTAKSADKKHRFQPEVIKGYIKAINYLIQARNKEELFLYRSLNFESLKGEKKGLYSVRADKQYRIEFTLTEYGDETIMTICNIIELTNHYD